MGCAPRGVPGDSGGVGETGGDESGSDGHDGASPGGSFAQREGKTPAFEV